MTMLGTVGNTICAKCEVFTTPSLETETGTRVVRTPPIASWSTNTTRHRESELFGRDTRPLLFMTQQSFLYAYVYAFLQRLRDGLVIGQQARDIVCAHNVLNCERLLDIVVHDAIAKIVTFDLEKPRGLSNIYVSPLNTENTEVAHGVGFMYTFPVDDVLFAIVFTCARDRELFTEICSKQMRFAKPLSYDTAPVDVALCDNQREECYRRLLDKAYGVGVPPSSVAVLATDATLFLFICKSCTSVQVSGIGHSSHITRFRNCVNCFRRHMNATTTPQTAGYYEAWSANIQWYERLDTPATSGCSGGERYLANGGTIHTDVSSATHTLVYPPSTIQQYIPDMGTYESTAPVDVDPWIVASAFKRELFVTTPFLMEPRRLSDFIHGSVTAMPALPVVEELRSRAQSPPPTSSKDSFVPIEAPLSKDLFTSVDSFDLIAQSIDSLFEPE